MVRTRVVIVAFLFCFSAAGQRFGWPLDSPCVITGNYGEIRPNHFHAGIDLSTGGRVNRKVYAAADGYVSRIRVNSGAYGRAVYITHPVSKQVTVYAHLNKFNLAVTQVVEKEQFARKSFEVELLPAPGVIPVKKGEVIGLSGNTGNSSGPHLHFEIRDEVSETPLNPLEFLKVPDTVGPVLEALGFFDLADTLQPRLIRSAKIHPATVSQRFVVPVNEIGVAFAGYDRINAWRSRNNIYGADLFFDEQLVYSHTLRAIDFADMRFVNEFCETSGRHALQKCFVPTLYPPRLYNFHAGKGTLRFRDTLEHKLRLVLRDEAGNTASHAFGIRWSGEPAKNDVQTPPFVYADCTRDFVYNENGLRVYIPGGTLFRSARLEIGNGLEHGSRLSILPQVSLRDAYVVSFKVPAGYIDVPGKLVLRSKSATVPGMVRNDSLYFQLKQTGQFVLLADVDPPAIRTHLSQKRIARTKHFQSFSFRITDALSGIGNYSMHVNGQWVPAEYDAKSDRYTYYFDSATPRGPLQFVVEVEDRCGNKKRYSYKLAR